MDGQIVLTVHQRPWLCVFCSVTWQLPGLHPRRLPRELKLGCGRPQRAPSSLPGSAPSLTCIVVKHGGHVLLWESVVGVAHQQAGFPHGAVPHHHTLQHLLLLRAPAATAAVTSLCAAHPGGSSCWDWAVAVVSPASPQAHGAREASEQRTGDHSAFFGVPGVPGTCPRQLAHALMLTILFKKGSTHLGERLKASVPFSL